MSPNSLKLKPWEVLNRRLKENNKRTAYFSKFIEKMNLYSEYNFQLWNYICSHSVLTVRGTFSKKKKHNVHLIFQDVRYIEMPCYFWRAKWRFATEEEIEKVVSPLHEQYFSSEYLLCAESDERKYYVLCGDMAVQENVEPIFD